MYRMPKFKIVSQRVRIVEEIFEAASLEAAIKEAEEQHLSSEELLEIVEEECVLLEEE